MPLPNFEIPTIYDLRRLWVERKGDREVRNLILEIERTRRVMLEIQRLYEVVDKCWKADVGGNLVWKRAGGMGRWISGRGRVPGSAN
jgi:hypothetical protein